MGFLQNAVFAVFIFSNTFVSVTLGFFHLPQHQAIPPAQTTATTTQAIVTSAQSTAATTTTSKQGPRPGWGNLSSTRCGPYSASGGIIYFASGNSETPMIEADSNTFRVFCNFDQIATFARDNAHIFVTGSSTNIDAASFDPVGNEGLYGKDRNHVYWFDENQSWGVIKDADPLTFFETSSTSPFAID